MRGDRDERQSSTGGLYYLVQFVLEIAFMFLGMMIVAWFSRWREFRADKGGASLAGRDKMIGALQSLQRTFEYVDPNAQPAVQTLKISSRPGGIMRFFSTHPPLSERIARLEAAY
jgi:heat shock protein HtpX